MLYKCIRTCFVKDVLWEEGKEYNLSDDMHKSEKNFIPVDESVKKPETPEKPKAPLYVADKDKNPTKKAIAKKSTKKGK